MNWASQQFLLLALVFAPLTAWFLWWTWRRKQRAAQAFVKSRLFRQLTVGLSTGRQIAKRVLLGLAVVALLLALGLEQPDGETPKYILDAAARLFAVKAGARKAKAAGRAAQLGSDAERPLVAAWNEAPPHGWPAITHADAMPRELLPLLDRHQPRLSWSPDGWSPYRCR